MGSISCLRPREHAMQFLSVSWRDRKVQVRSPPSHTLLFVCVCVCFSTPARHCTDFKYIRYTPRKSFSLCCAPAPRHHRIVQYILLLYILPPSLNTRGSARTFTLAMSAKHFHRHRPTLPPPQTLPPPCRS